MMSDLDILCSLIRDEAVAKVSDDYGKKIITLEENSGGSRNEYSVELRNVPGDVIAIKADMFPAPTSIFKDDNGECKRADYVVIVCGDAGNWIVYIEMKKRGVSRTRKEFVQQLKGAECFVSYCREIGRIFWGNQKFLDKANYEQRFVSITDIGLSKKPTVDRRYELNDRPENMLKIKAPGKNGLQFRQLLGK